MNVKAAFLQNIKISTGIVKDKDYVFSLFVAVYLVLNAANSSFQTVFPFLQNMLFKLLIMGILGLFLVYAISFMKSKEIFLFATLEAVMIVAYVYSYALGAPLGKLASMAVTSLMVCVPLGVCAFFIEDKQILYRMLFRSSWVILALSVFEMIGNMGGIYSQHFSYMLCLVAIIHSMEMFNRKKWGYILLIAAEIAMIVFYGSRGALICIFAYYILKVVTNIRDDRKRIVILSVVLLAGLFLFLFASRLGELLYNYLLSMGYNIRTLKILARGDFITHDSGRSELWDTVIRCIKEKPFTGWGICGAVDEMGFPYPHQFYMDLVLSFGWPIGVLLAIVLFFPVIHTLYSAKGTTKELQLAFLCIGFLSLMVSGTLFSSYFYAIFLGLAAAVPERFKKTLLPKTESADNEETDLCIS